MNVQQMRILARSLTRDWSLLEAHFLRFINLAYTEFARQLIIPKLNSGEPVELSLVSTTVPDTSSARFVLPYDFCRSIAFFDGNKRSMDVFPSEDVRQVNEYDGLGSFTQFYEHTSAIITPLYDSVSAGTTVAITNRSTTATASSAIFTDAHVGEWLLPINLNTTATAGNPEDYAYRIASTTGTVASPSTTCTLERPFRGVLTDSGSITDLSTSRFEIRPRNSPVIRIWGKTGTNPSVTIYSEYQRTPSKLANPEDIPEEPRLCEAIVFRAIMLAGVAFREAFLVKSAEAKIAESLSAFQTAKDFDRMLIRNFVIGNPNSRSHGEYGGMRMGGGFTTQHGGIRY